MTRSLAIRGDINLERMCPSPEVEKAEISRVESKDPAIALPLPRRPRKKVSFNKLVYVRETLHISDYDDDEMRDTWFDKSEMAAMKAELVTTVRLFLSGKLEEDTDEYTMRGLEFRSREGARKRKENKLRGLEAVLGEQDDQYDAGIINPKAISMVYQQVNIPSRIEAFDRGVQDEVAAYGRRLRDDPQLSQHSSSRSKQSTRIHRLLRRNSGSHRQLDQSQR